MPNPGRIGTMRDVTAMVALDTVDLLAERVRNLLSHGRRITLVTRFTYIDEPPKVQPGLTVDGEPGVWHEDGAAGFTVRLQPGILNSFGVAAYATDGNETEEAAWKRYHAAKSISDDYYERRRDMTQVDISGGLPNDWPGREDRIVIRAWNHDGVCEETVVAFDPAREIDGED